MRRALFAALRERWPEPERETGLRLVAMLAIGAMRLSFDALSREGGKRPLTELLHESVRRAGGRNADPCCSRASSQLTAQITDPVRQRRMPRSSDRSMPAGRRRPGTTTPIVRSAHGIQDSKRRLFQPRCFYDHPQAAGKASRFLSRPAGLGLPKSGLVKRDTGKVEASLTDQPLGVDGKASRAFEVPARSRGAGPHAAHRPLEARRGGDDARLGAAGERCRRVWRPPVPSHGTKRPVVSTRAMASTGARVAEQRCRRGCGTLRRHAGIGPCQPASLRPSHAPTGGQYRPVRALAPHPLRPTTP